MTESDNTHAQDTLADRIQLLEAAIADDCLCRDAWTADAEDGRRLACILSTLSPEVAEAEASQECPTSVMPRWLASLTPWISDSVTASAWGDVVLEFASLLRASSTWGEHDQCWIRLEASWNLAVLETAGSQDSASHRLWSAIESGDADHASEEEVLTAWTEALVATCAEQTSANWALLWTVPCDAPSMVTDAWETFLRNTAAHGLILDDATCVMNAASVAVCTVESAPTLHHAADLLVGRFFARWRTLIDG